MRAAVILAALALLSGAQALNITVEGRRLLVNGQPLFMKGVNYNPVPIGENPWTLDTYAFDNIVDRDIPRLKAAGINVIRLHSFNTWNLAKKLEFLNKLYQNQIFAIPSYGFNVQQDFTSQSVKDAIKKEFMLMVNAYYDHPAVLMWIFGNELNQPTKNNELAAFSFVKEVKDAVHAKEGAEHWHPFTTPLIDIDPTSAAIKYADAVDLWAMQSYRGFSFGNLFSEFKSKVSKPMFIAEYGLDAFDTVANKVDETTQTSYVSNLFNQIKTAALSDDTMGGVYFQYSDAWWKRGSVDTQDIDGWQAPGFPDKMANEEYWGLFSVTPGSPNGLVPRKVYTDLSALHAAANPYGVNFVFPTEPLPDPVKKAEQIKGGDNYLSFETKVGIAIAGVAGVFALIGAGIMIGKRNHPSLKKPTATPADV